MEEVGIIMKLRNDLRITYGRIGMLSEQTLRPHL